MSKSLYCITASVLALLAVFASFRDDEHDYDLVIYGGGPQAVSTALAAKRTNKPVKILMVVPERALGSILTLGKQNLFDVNYYKPKSLPRGVKPSYEGSQAGTFYYFMQDVTAVFPPDRFETYLAEKLSAHKNIEVAYETDITEVKIRPAAADAAKGKPKKAVTALSNEARPTAAGSAPVHAGGGGDDAFEIESVVTRPLVKGEKGYYRFSSTAKEREVRAPLFVDASETGRLVRFTGEHVGTVGREDQNPDGAQMAATLMFKLKGLDAKKAVIDPKLQGKALTYKGSFQLWAGHEMRSNPVILAYDAASPFFRIKPYNAGEDGYSGKGEAGSTEMEFWMNMLLVYNVDARKTIRDADASGGSYPSGGGLDPEVAREMALKELKKPAFIQMLRSMNGLENAELVMKDGEPVAGEMLYIRESVHTANVADPATRTYRFALDKNGVTGNDEPYYESRIGLGYYHFDSNSYKKGEQLSNPLGKEPWYVPYDVLRSPKLTNVLIPGYAANMDSFAWTAMRVYPNLIMLGDAAGTAAALSLERKFSVDKPTPAQMKLLQQQLKVQQVILDK
ncbi:FAD-dependent oxidoreductase [Paenibacillus sp. MBLB4367]|uniref:FAD-dependent oxidoreductase n=1 Tax=Paenibacillus sp. MBLB4367 TaxID=3384767 RepID=UPI003908442D